MKAKQTIKKFLLVLPLTLGIVSFVPSLEAYAATCAGVTTSIISCDQTGQGKCPDGTMKASTDTCSDGSTPRVELQDSGLWGILLLAINILTAGVGVAAVAGIVYGAVLYTTAGGDQNRLKKSLEVIRNVVIGVIGYAVMYSALNFLIPGGVFNP